MRDSAAVAPDAPMGAAMASEEISLPELVRLCATDSRLFCKSFFPKVYRQGFAPFHAQMWDFFEKEGKRLRMAQVFRGGAKTTNARAMTAKRIAYGISHTIFFVGKSEGKALHAGKWLRNQIEYNRFFASTFQLKAGSKWRDAEFEIIHGVDEYPIWVVCSGIEGSLRGLNIDGFRPDLIVLDDVLDKVNSGTPEQRKKIEEDMIYGAIKQSLAPRSEAPEGMILGLQTPLDREDFSVKAATDPDWDFMKVACWTPETAELPLDSQRSAWEERFPTPDLREDKRGHMRRNMLSVWMREMECKCTSPETSAFRTEWLRRWSTLPLGLTHILVIDPVPPPTPGQIARGFEKKDYEAFAVLGFYAGDIFVREVVVNRGHDPLWTVNEFFRLVYKYNPIWASVESIGYQAVLAWLLRQAMIARRRYVMIQEFKDQRSKYSRIIDGLTGVAAEGHLFLPPAGHPEAESEGMQMFMQQFADYPAVSHDDALEVVAVGCAGAQGKLDPTAEGVEGRADDDEQSAVGRYGEPIEERRYLPGEHIAP